MTIGCLGDVVFHVSSDVVLTMRSFSWNVNAKYATHLRHGAAALTEFTGLDAEKFTFEVTLSKYLGVDVQGALKQLMNYVKQGTTLPLVLGSKVYGTYRWVILQMAVKSRTFDGHGNLTEAVVTLSLQEYLRR